MAVDPIIVDCGGSTRIKWLDHNGVGAMNGLLDVGGNPPQASETVHGPFTQVKIAFIDTNGEPQKVGVFPLAAGGNFAVGSLNGQTVQGTIDATGNGKRTITLQGTPGNPPLVEAKQFEGKRRYVVSNAGPIQTITVNGVVKFDLGATPSLYATLFLS